MAELIKYHSAEVLNHIRHNFRELPAGKSHGNESIDPDLSSHNYSLLKDRCQTADTANQYRKDLKKNSSDIREKIWFMRSKSWFNARTTVRQNKKRIFLRRRIPISVARFLWGNAAYLQPKSIQMNGTIPPPAR